jgi:hypothetical protein
MLPSRITRGAAACRVTTRVRTTRWAVRARRIRTVRAVVSDLVAVAATRRTMTSRFAAGAVRRARVVSVGRRDADVTRVTAGRTLAARRPINEMRLAREARSAVACRAENAMSGSSLVVRTASVRTGPVVWMAAEAWSTGSRAGVTTASAMAPAVSARLGDGRCSVASDIGPGHSRESHPCGHYRKPRRCRPSMDSNGNPDNSSFPSTMPTHIRNVVGRISHNQLAQSRKRMNVEVSIVAFLFPRFARDRRDQASGTRAPRLPGVSCSRSADSRVPRGTSNGNTPRTVLPGATRCSSVGVRSFRTTAARPATA